MLLFVNACMRGAEISRTHKLCREFLRGREFEEVDLTKKIPPCLDGDAIKNRDALIDSGDLNHDAFALARQFARAEEILIGAPYWDLSFPAALKAYVENICVRNITFKTTATGVAGICRAKKLTYISTAGGFIKNANFGADYFRALCGFFGIPNFENFFNDALDIQA
jgi:FMN-dependent NADH-azoreductase